LKKPPIPVTISRSCRGKAENTRRDLNAVSIFTTTPRLYICYSHVTQSRPDGTAQDGPHKLFLRGTCAMNLTRRFLTRTWTIKITRISF
jgi:hypothetical protein